MTKINFVFFGSSPFSTIVLNELKRSSVLPSIIVTLSDKPKGRGLVLSPNIVKSWGQENNIQVLTPESLSEDLINTLKKDSWDVFIVASYGKIIPESILNIPLKGCLNVHPSMLPKYRGASPLQSMILNDEKDVGVSIMLMDKEMDHGPIVAQKKILINDLPIDFETLQNKLAEEGGRMLAQVMPKWIKNEVVAVEQNHSEATYTKKIKKEDGLLNINDSDGYKNYLKFLAFKGWPGIFFFKEINGKKIRIKITEAEFKDNKFLIKKVIKEGERESVYKSN